MKHKAYKRIAALALTLMLVFALSATAFAAQEMDSSGVVGSTSESLNKTLNIPVKLKVYNPETVNVYAPNITYTFTVAAGSAGKEITDSTGVKAKTKTAAVPTYASTLSWASASTLVGASSSGDDSSTANVQNLALDFSGVSFGAAGVYRYTITESATYTGTGVTAGATGLDTADNTKHVLYLDVYVKDGTAAGDTIYGYVLHTADDDTTTSSTKVGCFEDEYYTSNLKVTKTLVGDAAKNTNQFPMNVAFDASSITAGFHLVTRKTGTNATVSTLADKTYTDAAAAVANGATANYIEYVGIPTGVTFTVTETNNVQGTTYNAQYAIDGGTASTAAPKYYNETLAATTTTVAEKTAHTVDFTNTLALISPTGVVLRVAPYVFMLAAGIFLLTLSRRRRRATED